MAYTVNKAILVGKLGRDAETTFTPGGTAVTRFSIATDRSWKDKNSGEWQKATTWHNIVAWQKESLANYLLKGTQVYVEGRIENRSYEDKQGNQKYISEVIVENIVLLGSKSNGDHAENGDQPQKQRKPAAAPLPRGTGGNSDFDKFMADKTMEVSDDDVPFS